MSKLPDTSKMSRDELTKLMADLEEQHAAAAEAEKNKIKFKYKRGNIPIGVIENAQQLYDHFNISCQYNKMNKEKEIDIPGEKYDADTKNTSALADLESLYDHQGLPTGKILGHISKIANRNAYHPVCDWIDSIVWDGTSRLNDFYKTVTLNAETHGTREYVDLAHTLMRKWAISAIAAIYSEKVYIEGVLCFQGKQGIGKSRWPHYLMPSVANDWVADGLVLDPTNKDSVVAATSVWIGELSELDATFRKADISALKAFLTKKVDRIRMPYDAVYNKYIRRTVYVATVNDSKFLHDDENRRFWVLAVDSFNPPTFDIGQFWAEMKQIYLSGAKWILDDNERELLGKMQEPHKSIDPIEEIIDSNIISAASTISGEWLNTTAILDRCGVKNANKAQLHTASKYLHARKHDYRQSGRQYFVEFGHMVDISDNQQANSKLIQFKKKRDD